MNPNSDSDPVLPKEIVLRRISTVYYSPLDPIPIKPEAFRPTDMDGNGISVFREQFISSQEIFDSIDIAKRNRFVIARLVVRELQKLKLSVVPDPISALPGHALVPELNSIDYKSAKT